VEHWQTHFFRFVSKPFFAGVFLMHALWTVGSKGCTTLRTKQNKRQVNAARLGGRIGGDEAGWCLMRGVFLSKMQARPQNDLVFLTLFLPKTT
jgi:hypothetical protein